MASRTRSYKDAIDCLNSCQSNAATIEAIRKSGGKANQFAIPEMMTYLSRIGYCPSDLNRLNVLHVTGTKGKGSTCAFVEKIIRGSCAEKGLLGPRDGEVVDEEDREFYGGIGLYTSPHLCAVRERIRINGRPLPEQLFAKYFFQVWDRLTVAAATGAPTSSDNGQLTSPYPSPVPLAHSTNTHPPIPPYPIYFRLLTLLSFHTFLSLKVRATVLEVGIGGTYDSTNIVPKPLVTGVTSLGIDHTFVLGNTVEEIARNKGGIYKPGVPALAVKMDDGKGEKELEECAREAGASSFSFVSRIPELERVNLGLPGKHQIINASLAVAMCNTLISQPSLPNELSPLGEFSNSSNSIPLEFIPYLESARWPGRCQTVIDPTSSSQSRKGKGKTTWYLDGAHTVESLDCCSEWVFSSENMGMAKRGEGTKRVLIFNCTSGRSASALLEALLKGGESRSQSASELGSTFDHVIFCTNVTYVDGGFKGDLTSKAIDPNDLSTLATQNAIAEAWLHLVPSFPKDNIHVLPSIEHAVKFVRSVEDADVDVLTAGSLHLVGGMIDAAGLADEALHME